MPLLCHFPLCRRRTLPRDHRCLRCWRGLVGIPSQPCGWPWLCYIGSGFLWLWRSPYGFQHHRNGLLWRSSELHASTPPGSPLLLPRNGFRLTESKGPRSSGNIYRGGHLQQVYWGYSDLCSIEEVSLGNFLDFEHLIFSLSPSHSFLVGEFFIKNHVKFHNNKLLLSWTLGFHC